jgi:HSP20 family protein
MAQDLKVHHGELQEGRQGRGARQVQRTWPALSQFDEFDRLFDELMPLSMFRMGRSPGMRGFMGAQPWTPGVDVLERDDEIVLRAEVPGIRKDDLDISIDEGSVTIRGLVQREEKDAEGDYFRRELAHGEFVRTIGLPVAVETEKVKASLKDGVLELVMPKLERARRRKIEIK